MIWLLEQIDSPGLRVHFDISHFNVQGLDMEAVIAQIAPHSVHTHVKDERGVEPDYEFLIPGEGECDYVRYLQAMERAGYDGHITVEISVMVSAAPITMRSPPPISPTASCPRRSTRPASVGIGARAGGEWERASGGATLTPALSRGRENVRPSPLSPLRDLHVPVIGDLRRVERHAVFVGVGAVVGLGREVEQQRRLDPDRLVAVVDADGIASRRGGARPGRTR